MFNDSTPAAFLSSPLADSMAAPVMSVPLFDFELAVAHASQNHLLMAASAISTILALAGISIFRWSATKKTSGYRAALANGHTVHPVTAELVKSSPTIDALPDFHYARNPPPAFRPYKSKYYFTMGLQANPLNELVLLDSTYRQRLAYRRHLLGKHPATVLGHLPHAANAVQELYSLLLKTYLPARYPSHFSLTPSGTLFHNHVTTQTHPVVPPSTRAALKTLGENLDDDFVLLQPDAEGIFRVSAFVLCFPSGFELSSKLGCRMSEIHAPVPGLEAKLGKSIERFFGKLAPGAENGVRRLNWSIVRSSELYTPAGNHVHDDAVAEMGKPEDVVPENCCLRVERQTLFKLPNTGALAFGIKTYVTPLSQIRAEGGGRQLAEAIDGLGGEDDALPRYKGRGVWGEKVLEYLRS